MKLNFCTLFNTNYLSRGLTLYESLLKTCPDFHLYVFAFDDQCFDFLKSQNYKHLTPISLKQFEDQELLNIKSSRSAAEYCWTCTPSTILYSINTFGLDHCTYLDADMFFYSNPEVLIEEMKDKSVLITEHRYTKDYDQSATSGKYCVQFMAFKNNQAGMEVLQWWRNACIKWCYARHEDGKFGDQKYLDDWTSRFNCVHELKHLGGGLAPWNVQQYSFKNLDQGIVGQEESTSKKFEVVFFHFHGLKFYEKDMVSLTDAGYEIDKNVITIFYKPYVRALTDCNQKIVQLDISLNANGAYGRSPKGIMSLKTIVEYYLNSLKSSRRNLLGLKLFRDIKQHYFFKASKF